MKISVILPDHAKRIYGGFLVVFTYANYLAEKGHDVTIYYMMKEFMDRKRIPTLLQRLVSYYVVNNYPKWFKLNKHICRKYIFTGKEIEDADVIIATEIRTVDTVVSQAESKGRKVYFIQGFENWGKTDEYVKSTYGLGMHNIVVSDWLKRIVDENSVVPAICIKNGVDNTKFYYDKYENKIPHSITFHYRSEAYKGGDIALKVFERLYQRYPDITVDVITSESSLPEMPRCCKRHIRISASEVAAINRRTKVFLCTSREEGYGLPGLEAMACGCALVSTKYNGVFEYASDFHKEIQSGNSVLVDIDDIDGLENAITDIFENSAKYETMIKNGIVTASEMTSDKAAEKFENELHMVNAP